MKDITKIGELQTQISRRLDNLLKLREMVVVNHHPRKVLINRNTIKSICSSTCTSGCYFNYNRIQI